MADFFSGDQEDSPYVDPNLDRKQKELLRQQEEEKKQLKQKAERDRINTLRGRFGGGGSSSGGAQDAQASSSSLFSRITGRNQ